MKLTINRIYNVSMSVNGQIVIPKPLREKFHLTEKSLLRIKASEDGILIQSLVNIPLRINNKNKDEI